MPAAYKRQPILGSPAASASAALWHQGPSLAFSRYPSRQRHNDTQSITAVFRKRLVYDGLPGRLVDRAEGAPPSLIGCRCGGRAILAFSGFSVISYSMSPAAALDPELMRPLAALSIIKNKLNDDKMASNNLDLSVKSVIIWL